MRKLSLFLPFLILFAVPVFGQTVTGKVTLADGSALPGVTVSIEDLGLMTVTDANGVYTLTLPPSHPNEVKVSAELQGFSKRTATVSAAGDATHDFVLRPSFGQEITVGSRAIGAEAEKAVPVDVIPREQIESTPSTETNQIIQKLSPSFNFPRPTITDGTDSVRPATLRGLGPDQLLVMINGKRRHASALVNANNSIGRGSSGVDLNAIPASAIENIEILRDGAAAQYGSDAIAGVINLVLKSEEQPIRVGVKTGMTTHSDGQVIDTNINGGWKTGPGTLFATFEWRDRYETNRAEPDPRDQIVAGDAGHNAVPQPNHHWGDSYARDLMAFANWNLPMTADGKQILYAFGGFSKRYGSHGGFYRRALDARNHKTIYPLGFLPLIQPRVVDDSLTAGLRGESASKWFYDVSAGYGHNKFAFYVADSLNASLGPTIPPNQKFFYSGTLADRLLTVNADLSKGYNIGMAGPLNVAVGAEYRTEGYEIQAGEPNSYIDGGKPDQFGGRAAAGAQVFPGFRPSNEVDTSRSSKALYVDLEGDVLPQVRVGVAGRFEDFSDFGNTTNGKLTLRYSPVKQLIFRGAASTGFRAPSLSQSYFSAVSTNFLRDANGQLAPFDVGTYPVSSPIAKALGAQPLKPEKSKNVSAGVVFQPMQNLELTADYFHIDIDDRIVFSGNFTGAKVLPLIQPFGVTGARFFTNAIDTKTEGIDLVANYQRPLIGGRIDLSAAYSHNSTDIVGTVATPPQLAGLSEVLFDRIERRRIECGQPHDNIRLMQSWNRSALSVTAREARYGDFCSFTLLPIDDQTYSSTWIADLELGYKWRKLNFSFGAENLFDAMPDENYPGTPQGNFGIFPYPSHSPFGMNGRFVYTRVGYTF
jgi:iron complex outermembrane receptor protein